MNGTMQRMLGVQMARRAGAGMARERGMRNGARWAQGALLLMLGLLLTACGGGNSSDGGSGNSVSVTTTPQVATISGIAATGAPVQGIVTLKDVPTGKLQATHTDDGRYTFNVTGLKGPFLLRIVSDDHATTLYGVALRTGKTTRGHLNPLTNRIVAYLAEAPYSDYAPLARIFNEFPGPFAELDADTLAAATQQVLLHTSPYFRTRLQVHGVAMASLDPVAGLFSIGQGLDLAFDDVRFFYDDLTGEAWEKSVASGAIVGANRFVGGLIDPWWLSVKTDNVYLMPETSQSLSSSLHGAFWMSLPVRRGVRWELSDASLASINENGVVTAKSFTGSHPLRVTAYYQNGDQLEQASLILTLVEQAPVASVDMSELANTFEANGSYELFTTVQLTPEAGGGTLQSGDGIWTLVDPDPYAQASVQLQSDGYFTWLSIGTLPQDMDVRLRAVQSIGGQQYTTEKVVTLKRKVPLPMAFELRCPWSLDYNVTTTCTGEIIYDDYSRQQVLPELSVDADDAAYVTVDGATLTSNWDNKNAWQNITVKASYEGMTAVQGITLNQRRLRATGLEIVGASEMSENTTTAMQAWATWDDGTRSDVSSSVSWLSSDTTVAEFVQYRYGSLQSYYLLDQQTDKVISTTASICPEPSYGCAANERLQVVHPVTIRNASLALVGLDLSSGMPGYGFAQQGQSYSLTARAVWNKKQRDGSPYTTAIPSGVEWSSDNAAAVVSGNTLMVGAVGSEHLTLVTARYHDPYDAGVIRTARRVISLYSQLGTPRTLSESWQNPYNSVTYLLGGDGLARPLGSLPYPQSGRRVGAPDPFITRVKQVVRSDQGLVYLRDDGTVWYPEPISSLPLSLEMRDQLTRQSTDYSPVVPRRIPGVSNIVMLAHTSDAYFVGGLFALSADGSVYKIKIVPPSTTRNYSVAITHTGVIRIASGDALHMLMQDGTIRRRTSVFYDNTEQVLKSDNSPLTGIVDVAMRSGGGMARAGDGTLWTWGSNYSGQLGLGDNLNRSYASPITSVTGFSQLAGMMPAALRSDGTLWSWGIAASTLPQQVTGLPSLATVTAGYAVAADGKVWWWGRDPGAYELQSPFPVFVEGSTEGPQLTLP